MKSRAVMRRRQGKPEGNSDVAKGKKQIPDNSEKIGVRQQKLTECREQISEKLGPDPWEKIVGFTTDECSPSRQNIAGDDKAGMTSGRPANELRMGPSMKSRKHRPIVYHPLCTGISGQALKQLRELGHDPSPRILGFVDTRVSGCDHPRQFGKCLHG